MTPIEQQQMMQEYVRQMLAQRGQNAGLQAGSRPPLAGAELPVNPGAMPSAGEPGPGMRPPLDVSAGSGGPPGLSYGGGYAPQMGRAGQPEPFNAQLMYRKNVPF